MTLHRLLLLCLTIVVLVAAHPPSADAGTFDVVACDQTVAGGANNSFAPYADPGMTAYTDCSPFGEGLVARNVYDNGTTPSGNRAAMIFDAPPGATLQRITFDGAIERHTCTYSAILAAGGRDFGGSAIWGYGPGTQCDYPYAEFRTAFNFPGQDLGLAAERVRLEAQWSPRAAAGTGGRASEPATSGSPSVTTAHPRSATRAGASGRDPGGSVGSRASAPQRRTTSGYANFACSATGSNSPRRPSRATSLSACRARARRRSIAASLPPHSGGTAVT